MKKCNDCNIEMIDGSLYGEPRFIDMEHDIDEFYVELATGEQTEFFGVNIDKINRLNLKVRVCPQCGKVEFYTDLEQ